MEISSNEYFTTNALIEDSIEFIDQKTGYMRCTRSHLLTFKIHFERSRQWT